MEHITIDTWLNAVNKEGLVLMDFWATWCQPCKMMEPVFQQLHDEVPHLDIVKVDADTNPELVQMFNVTSIPTMILFKNGEQVWSMTGAKPKGMIIEKLAPYV